MTTPRFDDDCVQIKLIDYHNTITQMGEMAADIERMRAALSQISQHRDYQIPTPQSIASDVLEGTPK